MLEMAPSYWFTTTRFHVEPGEDEETRPRSYGRQLAHWLRERFLALGYPAAEVIPEDWGWCVMCQRDPYALWVGCGNLLDYRTPSQAIRHLRRTCCCGTRVPRRYGLSSSTCPLPSQT